jgi:ribosome-associated heat shock protein Hsp15
VTAEEPAGAVRADQWLWAVRLFKSRSLATSACRAGHVKLNGRTVKPAAAVRVGDRLEARTEGGRRIVEVVRLIDKRVGAPVAVTCFVDHTPPSEAHEAAFVRRDRGTGRPTKRDRRRIDRLRGR